MAADGLEERGAEHHSETTYVLGARPEPEYLLERMGWLVRLRWIAAGGVLLTVVCAGVLRVVDQVVPLLGVTLGLGVYNAYAWSRWRSLTQKPNPGPLAPQVFWQLVGDVVALAFLLHWSGGAENPFVMFFAFHMALGAMLLPGALPLYLGLIAAPLHGLIVLGEFAGVLRHHSLFTGPAGVDHLAHPALLWRTPGFVLGYLLAFTLMLFGVIYFVRSVVERHRRAEDLRRDHDRVAVSRERLARIGEIAAGVAHAVRNPLHGLINSVDLLIAKGTSDPATNETFSLMAEACRRIESVTQRLLVLTRNAPLMKEPVSIDSLVQAAVKMASPRARGSGAQIETKLAAGGVVEADADRLTEALINVIDNAVDACRDGGTVTVRTLSAPDAGGVCIEVADTGAGITHGDLAKVFDSFFTTKPVGEGTGLGLPIARRIVEEHGGHVAVDSAPGKGTRVRFLIPRTEASGPSKEQA